ncbi:MAG: hypothetical protein Q4C29_02920 [bacterium]|nr:hypothetical protein [bacterium]
MAQYSLLERISKILSIIVSSPFFVSLLIVIVFTIAILAVNRKMKTPGPKYICAFAYIIIMVLVLIKYGKYILSFNDTIIQKLFSAMYFPNIITYICMLFITIFLIVKSFMKKQEPFTLKLGNIFSFSLIWFLFILILEVTKKEKIDIYDVKSIYSNETLMILIQASTYIFFIWIGILLINYIVNKIDKMSKKKTEQINTYQNEPLEEIKEYSNQDFYSGLETINKQKKQKEYQDIFNNRF